MKNSEAASHSSFSSLVFGCWCGSLFNFDAVRFNVKVSLLGVFEMDAFIQQSRSSSKYAIFY